MGMITISHCRFFSKVAWKLQYCQRCSEEMVL